MIKKFDNFNKFDPYGEERWDDRDNIEIIREIAVNLNLNPTEIKVHSQYIKEFIFTIDYPHRGILYYYIIDDLRKNVTTMTIRFGVPNHMIKVLRELTEREFVDAYTDLAEELKPNY